MGYVKKSSRRLAPANLLRNSWTAPLLNGSSTTLYGFRFTFTQPNRSKHLKQTETHFMHEMEMNLKISNSSICKGESRQNLFKFSYSLELYRENPCISQWFYLEREGPSGIMAWNITFGVCLADWSVFVLFDFQTWERYRWFVPL